MEGRSWLFRRQLIVFYRIYEPTERMKLKLVHSPFWLKFGPYPPECDKKDLMHAICSNFGGLLRSEIKDDFCHIKIQMDVQKPLMRGIFVMIEGQDKVGFLLNLRTSLPFVLVVGK